MKKGFLVIGGLIVVAVAATMLTAGGPKKNNNSSSNFNANVKSACNILTQSVADGLLGTGSISMGSIVGDTETSSAKVTSCTYTSADKQTAVALLVRAAKDKSQADTNIAAFQGKTNISGYGNKAYWSVEKAQLNILAHNNWYTLVYGSLVTSQRTQASAQQFADLIKNQL